MHHAVPAVLLFYCFTSFNGSYCSSVLPFDRFTCYGCAGYPVLSTCTDFVTTTSRRCTKPFLLAWLLRVALPPAVEMVAYIDTDIAILDFGRSLDDIADIPVTQRQQAGNAAGEERRRCVVTVQDSAKAGTPNTGLLLFRRSAMALSVLRFWMEAIARLHVAGIGDPAHHVHWWNYDQVMFISFSHLSCQSRNFVSCLLHRFIPDGHGRALACGTRRTATRVGVLAPRCNALDAILCCVDTMAILY